jgi:hypothetical protein
MKERHFQEAAVESLAGYNILIKQTNPQTSFLLAARKDLIIDYEALQQPEQTAKFRAEMENSDDKGTKIVSKK